MLDTKSALRTTHSSPPAPRILRPTLETLPKGRLIEISGTGQSARTTFATAMLIAAQRQGETCAWVQAKNGSLYPPDLASNGVDLQALSVVLIDEGSQHIGLLKASEILLRSGGFGLVVIDLEAYRVTHRDAAWQGRLLALTREHHANVILLTKKGNALGSLGPLISLRIEPQRSRDSSSRGSICQFNIESHFLKNKLGISSIAPFSVKSPQGMR